MYAILIALAVSVIIAIVSMAKTGKYIDKLKNNLSSNGFIVSDSIDVPDKDKECEPYCFLIDKLNKKWALAIYRSVYTSTYNYSDIIDYDIVVRSKGNEIINGEQRMYSVKDYGYNNNDCILKSLNAGPNNCEYIYMTIRYHGQAKSENVCSEFLLFEKQEGFTSAMHKDFLVSSVCIEDAKRFEALIYEIVCHNNRR